MNVMLNCLGLCLGATGAAFTQMVHAGTIQRTGAGGVSTVYITPCRTQLKSSRAELLLTGRHFGKSTDSYRLSGGFHGRIPNDRSRGRPEIYERQMTGIALGFQ